jgi:hypothetical protein
LRHHPSRSPQPLTKRRRFPAETRGLFQCVVLKKYPVGYFRCPECDLIQTERPTWLDEAYAKAICASDTGAINRNVLTCRLTMAVARLLGITPASRCLDFGGGHGVFVRMMRDRGLRFEWSDVYAKNLFAVGFEGRAADTYDLVTSFEVLEHLVDVSGELNSLFAGRPAAVLVGTMLHRGHEPGWWYYSPHTGQHVAFYSSQTMSHVAARFGYSAAGSRAHTLFIRNDAPIAPWRRRWAEALVRRSKGNATHRWVAAMEWALPRFPALTEADCQKVQQ